MLRCSLSNHLSLEQQEKHIDVTKGPALEYMAPAVDKFRQRRTFSTIRFRQSR